MNFLGDRSIIQGRRIKNPQQRRIFQSSTAIRLIGGYFLPPAVLGGITGFGPVLRSRYNRGMSELRASRYIAA